MDTTIVYEIAVNETIAGPDSALPGQGSLQDSALLDPRVTLHNRQIMQGWLSGSST